MNLQQYRDKLEAAKQQIINALPVIATEIAESTLSEIKDRSTNEGILVNGQKKEYSKKTVPTSWFSGKELNAAGSAYIEANDFGTWGAFRKAQGREGEVVNLGYTMRMWTGIQVIRVNMIEPGKYETIIGASDEETREKISHNEARYGRFFDPTTEEAKFYHELAKQRLSAIIKGI